MQKCHRYGRIPGREMNFLDRKPGQKWAENIWDSYGSHYGTLLRCYRAVRNFKRTASRETKLWELKSKHWVRGTLLQQRNSVKSVRKFYLVLYYIATCIKKGKGRGKGQRNTTHPEKWDTLYAVICVKMSKFNSRYIFSKISKNQNPSYMHNFYICTIDLQNNFLSWKL